MPTKKPRLTITLNQDSYDAVKEFSGLVGSSMGGVISQMIDQSIPSLLVTIQLLHKAKSAPDDLLESITKNFEDASSKLLALDSSFRASAEGVCDVPPSINKGVRSTSNSEKLNKNNSLVIKPDFSKKGVK